MATATPACRAAGEQDLARLLRLDRQSSPVFAQAASYRSLLSDGLVLVTDGDAHGLAGLAAFSRVLDEATLLNLAVAPAFRGRGLARRLLRDAYPRLVALGVRRLLLEVRESNFPARGLYQAEGFVLDGRRPGYYPVTIVREPAVQAGGDSANREDALLMSRMLENENAGA